MQIIYKMGEGTDERQFFRQRQVYDAGRFRDVGFGLGDCVLLEGPFKSTCNC